MVAEPTALDPAAIAPEKLRPAQLAAIRKLYEHDPTIPKLAKKLGLSTEELLARLGSQTDPIFHVAPDYDREADVAAFHEYAGIARKRQDYHREAGRDGRADDTPDTVRTAKLAPPPGQRRGRVDGPAADTELQGALWKNRTRTRS